MLLTAKYRRTLGVNVSSHSFISNSLRPDSLKCFSIIVPFIHSLAKLGPQFETILAISSCCFFVGFAGFSTNAGSASSTADAVSITRLCMPTRCASRSLVTLSKCSLRIESKKGCSFLYRASSQFLIQSVVMSETNV